MLARPEETVQTIAKAPRHNVNVYVRHTLADTVVQNQQRAVRAHTLLDSPRHSLSGDEKPPRQVCGKIEHCLVVLLWNNQTVPRKEGANIEKHQREVILEDNRCLLLVACDPAKETISH